MCSLSPGTLSCSSPFLQTVLCAQNQTRFSNCMTKETDQSRTVLFWENVLRVKSTHRILLPLIPVSQLIILGKFFKNRDSRKSPGWSQGWQILVFHFRHGLTHGTQNLGVNMRIQIQMWAPWLTRFTFIWGIQLCSSPKEIRLFPAPQSGNFSTPLKLPDWSGQK